MLGAYHTTDVGGYRSVDAGGYRGVDAGGYRGVDAGTYRAADVGGYHAGAVNGHTAMATDFGFSHAVGAGARRGYVATGHYTTAYSGGVLAARGTAVRGGFYHYGAFNSGWWSAHPGAWRPAGWNVANAWGWATWPALTTWFGWSTPPAYYDYGNTIVYQGDTVYVNGQSGPTAAVYYQQAADLAPTAPPLPLPSETSTPWQPLGVFALVQGDQSDTSAVFQLAVNKTGIIRGNYYNVLTDTTLPVHGAVDPKTQRASWTVGDQKTTVYDTGLYNLTKDESPILIHFGKDRTQEWLLVRVSQKDGQAPVTPTASAADPTPPAAGTSAVQITVVVPANADVYFDGVPMTQGGTVRTYSSPPLEPGSSYTYSIRARWTANGNPVEQTRKVSLKAGTSVRVDFTAPLPG